MRTYFRVLEVIAANCTPLIGVIFFCMGSTNNIFLYWFEIIIIGFWNIFKMRIAELPTNFVFNVNMIPSLLILFIIHGLRYLSYVTNKEYKTVCSDVQMKEPYVPILTG